MKALPIPSVSVSRSSFAVVGNTVSFGAGVIGWYLTHSAAQYVADKLNAEPGNIVYVQTTQEALMPAKSEKHLDSDSDARTGD